MAKLGPGVGAHAAGVRAAAAVVGRLVVAGRRQHARCRSPSQSASTDSSGPVRHSSTTTTSAAEPSERRSNRSSSAASASARVGGDGDALAGGQPIRLDDGREPDLLDGLARLGVAGDDHGAGGRDADAAHQLLRPGLARLDPGGRRRRPEGRDAELAQADRRGRPPSGTSGPTTTRSVGCSRATRSTCSTSSRLAETFSARAAVPALPGVQRNEVSPGERRSAWQSACSRAPFPTTRTLVTPLLRSCARLRSCRARGARSVPDR